MSIDEYRGPPIATIKLAQMLDNLPGWKSSRAEKLAHLAGELDRASAVLRGAIAESGLEPATVEAAAERGPEHG